MRNWYFYVFWMFLFLKQNKSVCLFSYWTRNPRTFPILAPTSMIFFASIVVSSSNRTLRSVVNPLIATSHRAICSWVTEIAIAEQAACRSFRELPKRSGFVWVRLLVVETAKFSESRMTDVLSLIMLTSLVTLVSCKAWMTFWRFSHTFSAPERVVRTLSIEIWGCWVDPNYNLS